MTSITAFWDDYLGHYDVLNTDQDYRQYQDELARLALPSQGRKVLDAGSGTGNLSMRLKQLGAEVTSLDFSRVGLEEHLRKDPEAEQLQASLEEPLPLADGTFDRIVCASVLFTLSRGGVQNALREFRRVLQPGGRLVVTVGRPELSKFAFLQEHLNNRRLAGLGPWWTMSLAEICAVVRVLYYNYRMFLFKRQGYYRRFSRAELQQVIVDSGFHIENYRTVFRDRMHLFVAIR